MKRFRLKYAKEKELRFISHLDLIRLFERAFRRAQIALAYSQGYNPRQRIAYGPPLALGHTSDAEYLDFYLKESSTGSTTELMEKLQQTVPHGLTLLKMKPIPLPVPALSAQIETACYQITLKTAIPEESSLIEPLITRRSPKHGERVFDIRPMLKWLKIAGNQVETMVQANSQGTLKPEEVIAALGHPKKIVWIHRTGLFLNQGGKLRDPIL